MATAGRPRRTSRSPPSCCGSRAPTGWRAGPRSLGAAARAMLERVLVNSGVVIFYHAFFKLFDHTFIENIQSA